MQVNYIIRNISKRKTKMTDILISNVLLPREFLISLINSIVGGSRTFHTTTGAANEKQNRPDYAVAAPSLTPAHHIPSDELSLIPCQNKILGDWKIVKTLGVGTFGHVWEVVDSKGRIAAMKRVTPDENEEEVLGVVDEITASKRAGELGIGPEVYTSGKCAAESKREYTYIIQQKLSGPSLDKVDLIPPSYLTAFMDVYLKFVENTGWINADVHLGNVMSDNGRVYMIDYGLIIENKERVVTYNDESIILPEKKIFVEMREKCTSLLKDLAEQNAGSGHINVPNFLQCAAALDLWFYTHYPKAKRPLLLKKSENGLDKSLFGAAADMPALALWTK